MRVFFRRDRVAATERVIIEPGEYHTSLTARLITSVLGSCVSVCLKDESVGVSGMNHFLLPDASGGSALLVSDSGGVGVYAMELLINEMICLGAQRERLWAMVYGGAQLPGTPKGQERIAAANVRFATSYLEMERIVIRSQDVGGHHGRRITFDCGSGKVLAQRVAEDQLEAIAQAEQDYRTRAASATSDLDFALFEPEATIDSTPYG